MAIEYVWNFDSLECAISEDGLTNVVKAVNWNLSGYENGLSSSQYGVVFMESPNPENSAKVSIKLEIKEGAFVSSEIIELQF